MATQAKIISLDDRSVQGETMGFQMSNHGSQCPLFNHIPHMQFEAPIPCIRMHIILFCAVLRQTTLKAIMDWPSYGYMDLAL